MKCVFEFMNIKISLSSENSNVINYCIDYFKNFFDCSIGEYKDTIISIDIVEYFADKNNYILEEEKPFKIYVHKFDKKMIITNMQEKNYRELMRLIRELFVYYISLTKECCFFHAACVSNSEFAVAMIGDKFAGKTTMCLNFLRLGWNFISNDKLVLEKKEKDILCWGLPIALGIRDGTRQLFKEELDGLEIEPEDNRYYLTPNQLIENFNVEVANGQKLKMILIPCVCPEARRISVTKLTVAEAIFVLKKQRLESIYADRKKMSRLDAYSNDNLINSLIKIPVYKIVINGEINCQLKDSIEDILKNKEN